jgi:hypothetical protein
MRVERVLNDISTYRLHAALTNDQNTLVSGPPRQLHLQVLISNPLMFGSHNQKPTVCLQDHFSLQLGLRWHGNHPVRKTIVWLSRDILQDGGGRKLSIGVFMNELTRKCKHIPQDLYYMLRRSPWSEVVTYTKEALGAKQHSTELAAWSQLLLLIHDSTEMEGTSKRE